MLFFYFFIYIISNFFNYKLLIIYFHLIIYFSYNFLTFEFIYLIKFSFFSIFKNNQNNFKIEAKITKLDEKVNKEIDENNYRAEIFSRTRRVIKVVCRDSINLLDPPLSENSNDFNIPSNQIIKMLNGQEEINKNENKNKNENENVTENKCVDENKNENYKKHNSKEDGIRDEHHRLSVTHPALLTPLLATQDSSLKILQILSGLLDATGCALLLRNKSTHKSYPPNNVASVSTDSVYQGICTGTGFYWSGLPVGIFGNIEISTPNQNQNQNKYPTSLVESCMISGHTLALKDGTSDPRYCHLTDGHFLSGSPYMVTPIRGREGSIVGVLLALRKRGSVMFSQVRKAEEEIERE